MTKEDAEEYAKEMTYRDAVYNALQGKCIPYRKVTLIKLYELLDMVEPQGNCDTCRYKDDEWDSEHCDGCCGNHNGFKPQERSEE